jgi:uncharacterized protein YraI
MRLKIMACFAALAVGYAGEALAHEAIVGQVAALRAGPGAARRAIATLPAGAQVDVAATRRGWSLVSYEGLRGYVASEALAAAAVPSGDSNCDLGYPYSGSAAYFNGLTELRHSGPLGFFLGWHIRRPC